MHVVRICVQSSRSPLVRYLCHRREPFRERPNHHASWRALKVWGAAIWCCWSVHQVLYRNRALVRNTHGTVEFCPFSGVGFGSKGCLILSFDWLKITSSSIWLVLLIVAFFYLQIYKSSNSVVLNWTNQILGDVLLNQSTIKSSQQF